MVPLSTAQERNSQRPILTNPDLATLVPEPGIVARSKNEKRGLVCDLDTTLLHAIV